MEIEGEMIITEDKELQGAMKLDDKYDLESRRFTFLRTSRKEETS